MAEAKEKKATKTAPKAAKAAPAAEAAPGETCSMEKCNQPVRAKGLCRKHYLGWRRGKIGTKHRYKICSKEGCRKKALAGGRCEEHRKNATGGEAAAA